MCLLSRPHAKFTALVAREVSGLTEHAVQIYALHIGMHAVTTDEGAWEINFLSIK